MREIIVGDGTGMAAGGVRNLLRVEGPVLFSTMLVADETVGGSWSLFALLFLLPDISFAAYAAGPRIGGVVYNIAHSTIGPIMFAAFGHAHGMPLLRAVGIIWLAHVGLD